MRTVLRKWTLFEKELVGSVPSTRPNKYEVFYKTSKQEEDSAYRRLKEIINYSVLKNRLQWSAKFLKQVLGPLSWDAFRSMS